MIASHPHLVSFVESWTIRVLIVYSNERAFQCLKEIHTDQWVEQVDKLAQSTWRTKTNENLLWQTKREYIKKWQRGVLIMTTTRYQNLVVRWNV